MHPCPARPPRRLFLPLTRWGLALGALSLGARGATLTWDTVSGDGATVTQGGGTWTNGLGGWNNGVGDAVWNNATPDSAVFGGAGSGSFSVNLGGPVTAASLAFNAGPAYTIGSGTLTLSGPAAVSVAASTTATISSALAGSAGLAKSGAGTLILSGPNGYTGATAVNGGILRATTLGSVPTAVTVGSGGAFDANGLNWNSVSRDVTATGAGPGGVPGAVYNSAGGETQIRNLTLAGNATVGTSAGKLNFYGSLNGAGNTLTIAGTGETNIRTANSLSNFAGITVSSGLLRFESSQNPGSAIPITVNAGATLDTYDDRTMGANLSVILAGGTLRSEGPGGDTSTWNGPVTVNSPSFIQATRRIDTFGLVSGAGSLTKNGGDVFNIRGGVSGLTTLTVNAGRVRYEGTGLGAWTGGVTVNPSAILSPYGSLATSANVTLAGGTLAVENNGAATFNGTLTVNAPSVIDAAGTGSITQVGAVSGAGNLTKNGAGNLILTGNATGYGGTLTATAGIVRPTVAGTALPVGLAIGSGASLDLNALNHGARSVTISGTGAAGTVGALYNSGGGESWIQNITLSGNARIGTSAGKLNTPGTLTGGGNTLTIGGAGETNFRPGHSLVNLPVIQVSTTGSGRLRFEGDSAPASATSVQVGAGSIVDTWGNRLLGPNLALNLAAGATLQANGGAGTFTATWAGPVTVAGAATVTTGKDIVLNGALGGSGAITKTGAGRLTLGGVANTLTGAISVNGGTLVVATGAEQTLGNNPGAFAAGQLTLSGGTLLVTGASLAINDVNRGLSVGTGSGTFHVDPGLTLSVANPVAAGSVGSTLTKAGTGTFNLTNDAVMNALVIQAGRYEQNAGLSQVITTTTGLEIRNGGTYRLAGGTLRADRINVLAGGEFDWGAGTLTHYTTIGNAGVTDYSGPGYSTVKSGVTGTVTGNLSTEAGSVLALHGSPTLYLNGGTRFNNWAITGDLDLSAAGDTLELDLNPYLLRPFSSAGIAALETGSLPLVTWTGSFGGGTFDTVLGINTTQGGGFAEHTGPFVSAAALDPNTWYIEYDAAGKTIWFHYKVAGYVPEPQTALLAFSGILSLRYWRRLNRRAGSADEAVRRDGPARRSRLGY